MSVERFQAALPHGISLSCRASGDVRAPRRALFLHGFPEGAFIWDDIITALGGPDLHCVAPNLRGFEHSSAPSDLKAYRAKHLVADIAALIENMGAPIDVLVAHDWGGALAWNLAAQQPDLLKHLLIINAPHPATFLREMRDNPAQQAASAYMTFLCRPDAAALLADNDFARLWPFFENIGGAKWLTDDVKAQYRAVWSCGLEGPLNYYRASPLRPAATAGDAINTLVFPSEFVTVNVPTTVLWGDADRALPLALLDGLEAYVPRLSVHRIPGASHWVSHERPDVVIDAVRRVLTAGR
jgi:pimeloyl-ACP methyl ester carboxylesterase